LSILHTTFRSGTRSKTQEKIIERIIRRSKTVVVLTDRSKQSVEYLCGRPIDHAFVIPHGVPDFPYVEPPPMCRIGSETSRPIRLITPGFYRGDKGFEIILRAIFALQKRGYPITYEIAGEPQRQFDGQSQYRSGIDTLIKELNLESSVRIDCRYLPVPDQAVSIHAAHVGIFAYQDASQASSGTVPLVMGMGRPVLCTPFEYAMAKADEGPGVFLAKGFDESSIVDAIEEFIRIENYAALTWSIYERTRAWTWSAVGTLFEKLLLHS